MKTGVSLVIILAIMFALAPVYAASSDPSSTGNYGYRRLVVIVAPGMSPQEFREFFANSTKIDVDKTTIVRVLPTPPYSPLYLWLTMLSGSIWDLSSGVPSSTNTVVLPNGTSVEACRILSQSYINATWVQSDIVLVGMPGTNVSMINSTVNLWFSLEDKRIPPHVFILENATAYYWDLVGENITVTFINNTLKLSVGKASSVVPGNKSFRITVNITRSKYIEHGLYDLRFYVFKITNTTFKVVTLGTVRRDYVLSKDLEVYDSPITPDLPFSIFRNLTDGEIKLVTSDIVNFYTDLVHHVLIKKGFVDGLVIYYPLVEELKVGLSTGVISEGIADNLTKTVFNGISGIVNEIASTIGEENVLVMIVSPYSTSRSIDPVITVDNYVAPGLIWFNQTIAGILVTNNIGFKVIPFGQNPLMLIYDGGRVSYNGVGYGPGFIAFVNQPNFTLADTVDGETLYGYFATLGSSIPLKSAKAVHSHSSLWSDYNKLKVDYLTLNATCESYKDQLEKTRRELSDVKADYEKARSEIAELKKEINEANKRNQELTIYLTAGLASIGAIAVLYLFIVRSIALKR